MKLFANIFTPIIMLLLSASASAQNNLGEAKVVCPDSITKGEPFEYKITLPIDSTFLETVMPPFEQAGLKVLVGPSVTTKSRRGHKIR